MWKLPAAIGAQDIATALDSMPHHLIMECSLSRGVGKWDTALLMHELHQIRATITLPLAGVSAPLEFQRGGKQGGVETPDEWNAMVESILELVVQKWESLGIGFVLPRDDGSPERCLSHAVWADSVVVRRQFSYAAGH
eukprot:4580527-Pyramimonas_sp.AAC.1